MSWNLLGNAGNDGIVPCYGFWFHAGIRQAWQEHRQARELEEMKVSAPLQKHPNFVWRSRQQPPALGQALGWPNSSEKTWCSERLGAGEGGNRGWDGWMASPTQRTWVWADSRRQWRTGKPGVLKSMELQSQTQQSNWTTKSFFTVFQTILEKTTKECFSQPNTFLSFLLFSLPPPPGPRPAFFKVMLNHCKI